METQYLPEMTSFPSETGKQHTTDKMVWISALSAKQMKEGEPEDDDLNRRR